MFALSPTGTVVCLPFIGMEPKVAMQIAASWPEFERIIRGALFYEGADVKPGD